MRTVISKPQLSRQRSVNTTSACAHAKTLLTRAREHLALTGSQRDEAWIDAAWSLASDLRADGRADVAERLEDACERCEIIADGKAPPRQRRSDAPRRGPPVGVARTVASGLNDGYDLASACRYAGITPAAHEAWMRLPDYRQDFRAGSGGTP